MNRSHSSHPKTAFCAQQKVYGQKSTQFSSKNVNSFLHPEALGKGKALTDLKRGRIQGVHEAGLTGRAIAHAVNRPRDAVMRVVSGHVGRICNGRPQICPIVLFVCWFARQPAEISQQNSYITSLS